MELLPLVCLCLLSCSGDAVRVDVKEGSDAVLNCSLSTKEDLSGKYFDWRKDGQKEVFMYDAGVHSNNGLPGQDEQFKGRVSFFQDQLENGDASIEITRTKMADSGTYSCDFPRHQPRQTSIIELVVAVRVVVEEDSDAVLPCLISPKEDISGKLLVWKKDDQKEVFLYDAGIHYNNGRQGQDEQFKGRVSFFQDQLQNGNASIKITRTKMADSGTYSCDFPRLQPRQTSIIELVVGAAPEPVIHTLRVTKDWRLLQCEARGVSPLTVEWKNSTGNIHKSESTPISETGSHSSIALNITVTKTDDYSCVATQKQFSHQVTAVIPVYLEAVRVVVEEDSDAVLPCLISPKEDISGKLFDWKKIESQKEKKEVFMYDAGDYYNNGRQGQDEQFKGRVSFFQDQLQNGNASIKITGTKMADSGIYSCDFPRHQPRQTSIIELVVGAAPEPYIRTLADKKDWRLLQCEAHGVPRPTIKWQDSENKTLPAEEPKISERGGRFYITVEITVTKTDNYRCVATQETLSHQVAAVTSVYIPGWSIGWIVGPVLGALCVLIVGGIYKGVKNRKKDKKKSDAVELNPADHNSTTEPLKQPDP